MQQYILTDHFNGDLDEVGFSNLLQEWESDRIFRELCEIEENQTEFSEYVSQHRLTGQQLGVGRWS